MRLSELLGREVVTSDGEVLGKVHEALLVQDGRVLSGSAAAFRLHALAVGPRAFGAALGYFQGTVQGPAVLPWLFRRQPRIVPWAAIVDLDDERITIDAARLGDADGVSAPVR